MSLFLSYASPDRPLVEKVRTELGPYIEVFFAATSITGGAEWEHEIDAAIHRCKIFVPMVSEDSNASKWVAKETLLALSLGIPILPLLFSSSLPLRIVDRQFVDFRGGFEAGVSDLLSALVDHLGPLRRSEEAIDGLIAKAIRARLAGNIREANALVEQFVGPESALAENGYSFWRKLERASNMRLAENVATHLTIREATTSIGFTHYKTREAYRWAIEIHGARDHLESIDSVVYTLHPSFSDRIQKVRSREDNFRIERVGWGSFTVQIRVEFVDYSAFDGEYRLTFAQTNEFPLVRQTLSK